MSTESTVERYFICKKKNVRIDIVVYKHPDNTNSVLITSKRLIDFKKRKIASSSVIWRIDSIKLIYDILGLLFESEYGLKQLNWQISNELFHCKTNMKENE